MKESEKFVHTQNILKMATLKILKKKKKKKKNNIETDEDYNSQSYIDIQEKIDKKSYKTEIPITIILAKSLYPDLHLKTHFQRVSSIYNGQGKILKNKWTENVWKWGKCLRESAEILNKSNSTDLLFKNIQQPIPSKFLLNKGEEEYNNYLDSANPLERKQ